MSEHAGKGWLMRALLEPRPVYGAVYLRVVMAVWTFMFCTARLPYLKELYTDSPVMERSALMTILHVPELPIWLVAVMFVVLLVASIGFAVGYHARLMHLVLLPILVYLFGFDRFAMRGFGELGLYLWVWLFFTPYDRLWDENGRVVKAASWGMYLMWGQITVVYLSTFWGKLSAGQWSFEWWTGEAFYAAVHSKAYSVVFLTEWIDIPFGVAKWLGRFTLVAELVVPIAIWHRRTRPLAMLLMFIIHFGAGVTMRVTLFFQFLLLAQVPALASTEQWERLYQWLGLASDAPKRVANEG